MNAGLREKNNNFCFCARDAERFPSSSLVDQAFALQWIQENVRLIVHVHLHPYLQAYIRSDCLGATKIMSRYGANRQVLAPSCSTSSRTEVTLDHQFSMLRSPALRFYLPNITTTIGCLRSVLRRLHPRFVDPRTDRD